MQIGREIIIKTKLGAVLSGDIVNTQYKDTLFKRLVIKCADVIMTVDFDDIAKYSYKNNSTKDDLIKEINELQQKLQEKDETIKRLHKKYACNNGNCVLVEEVD
jgi:hypothetical protein